jgi:hypothetical protein
MYTAEILPLCKLKHPMISLDFPALSEAMNNLASSLYRHTLFHISELLMTSHLTGYTNVGLSVAQPDHFSPSCP